MREIVFSVILAIAFSFFGCASSNGSYYTKSDINSYSTVKSGTVINVKRILLNDNGTGTLLGGIVGGVVGNQIGSGRGRTVATVAGALLGGAAGNKINETDGAKLTIRLDSGQIIETVTEDYSFRKGDRVKIEFQNGVLKKIF